MADDRGTDGTEEGVDDAARAKAPSSPVVEFRRGEADEAFDPETSGYPRMIRRLFKSEAEKLRKKYGGLVHPETGERPTIVLNVSSDRIPKLTARLVTDSESLRSWLKERGIVISEVVRPGGEAAA